MNARESVCEQQWCMQCGGEKAAVAAAQPYLKLMGKRVVNCGQPGNGQTAKVASTPAHASCLAGSCFPNMLQCAA